MKQSEITQQQLMQQSLIATAIQESIDRAREFELSDEQKYVLFWEIRNCNDLSNGLLLNKLIKSLGVFIYTSMLDACKDWQDINVPFFEARQAIVSLAMSALPPPLPAQQELIDLLHTKIKTAISETCRKQKARKNSKVFKTRFANIPTERLERLNEKLRNEEKRLEQFYLRHLQPFREQLRSHGIVDDINVDYRLLVFSTSPLCNERHNVEEGDAIAEINFWSPEIIWSEANIMDDNWNELRSIPGHPLAGLHFCYTMHILAFDTPALTWEDIIDIDDVWLEIKTDYQFFTDKNNG